MRVYKASYFDGRSSKPIEVVVSFSADQTVVEFPTGERQTIPRKDLKWQPKIGTIPRVIDLPQGESLHIDVQEGLDQEDPSLKKWIHIFETKNRFVFTSIGVLLGFFLLLYFVIIPLSAKRLAPSMTHYFGESVTLQSLEAMKRLGVISQDNLQKYEERLDSIRQIEILKPYSDYKIYVFSSSALDANAFALPDKTILITQKLMDILNDDLEILAVILHEIGHVEQFHVMERVIQESIVSFGLLVLVGTDWTSLPMILLSASYSRDLEKEADVFAARILSQEELSATLLARSLQKMEAHYKNKASKLNGIFDFLSTHPSTQQRVQYLQQIEKKSLNPLAP